jgi:hypothetical protein
MKSKTACAGVWCIVCSEIYIKPKASMHAKTLTAKGNMDPPCAITTSKHHTSACRSISFVFVFDFDFGFDFAGDRS